MKRQLLTTLVSLWVANGCNQPNRITPTNLTNYSHNLLTNNLTKSSIKEDNDEEKSSPLEKTVATESVYKVSAQYNALLDTIGWAEGASYDILFGGKRIKDLSRYPNRLVEKWGKKSTAAGKYQITAQTYRGLRRRGLLKNFYEDDQDQAALYLVQKAGITSEILDQAIFSGNFYPVWEKLAPRWASFPTKKNKMGRYNQARYSHCELRRQFFLYFAHHRSNEYY